MGKSFLKVSRPTGAPPTTHKHQSWPTWEECVSPETYRSFLEDSYPKLWFGPAGRAGRAPVPTARVENADTPLTPANGITFHYQVSGYRRITWPMQPPQGTHRSWRREAGHKQHSYDDVRPIIRSSVYLSNLFMCTKVLRVIWYVNGL